MNRSGSVSGIKTLVITVAALFIFVVALLLDLQYLYIMATTLVVLPLASWTLATRFAARFSVRRDHAATVVEGRRVSVTLSVDANGGLPQAGLMVADTIPADLRATGDRSELQPMETWDGARGSTVYVVEPQKRGVYRLGPTRIETTDPLGLFGFEAQTEKTTELVVHPTPLLSDDSAVGGEGMYGTRERDGKTRRGEGMDFHGVREYQQGDALRRVHWPTTARTGKLAVVEFERAYQQDIVIGLDLARGSHVGEGRENTLEYAVKVAATLSERTLSAGGGVTLVTQGGRVSVRPKESDPVAARFRLLDLLAHAEADSDTSLGDALRANKSGDGTHYAILTANGDPRLTTFLTERIRRGDSVRVYYFEPQSFGGASAMSPAVAGGELRIVRCENSPWTEGGRSLAYLLRESA